MDLKARLDGAGHPHKIVQCFAEPRSAGSLVNMYVVWGLGSVCPCCADAPLVVTHVRSIIPFWSCR